MTKHPQNSSRRVFLRRMGQLSLAGVAAPWAANLAAMGDAAAFGATDYKALVCVFLYGGNDNANTLVPYDDASYKLYSSMRPELVVPRGSLASTVLRSQSLGGRQYALNPNMAALKPLFDSGRMAVQLNVGPLVRPTSLAEFRSRVSLPPKLFSHNDQQSIWQSSHPEGAVAGWGGRMGDLAIGNNGGSTFTCISLSGNNVFIAGERAITYNVGANGATAIKDFNNEYGACLAQYSPGCVDAFRELLTSPRAHVLENEYVNVLKRSIDAEAKFTAGTSFVPESLTDLIPDTYLGKQLRQVARIIAGRDNLQVKRQVFFVSLGGFDTHDRLMLDHPQLLKEVSDAMAAFYRVTEQLNVANQVTTFTASEFGRTMVSNGDGSDHAWGSEHFILGGAVRGGAFYGTPATLEVDAVENVGQGRFIPTTSVDQYAATLARWFGVMDSEMATVVPNLRNFSQKNLGFLG